MELGVLAEAIDELIGSDPSGYADGGSIEALQRQLARLDSFVTSATAAFDAAGAWAPDGARNASAWLATRCHLPKGQARRQVRRARQVRRLPACAKAWSAGDITAAHVDAIASVRRDTTEAALGRDEAMLVGQAQTLRFESFTRALAYWEQLADPDGAEDDDEARRRRRDVYLESSFNGLWLGRITLDPISGAIVAGELEHLEAEMFEADWAQARAGLGREPTSIELSRTPGQRRADALVEMATRSRSAPADGRRPAPLFSVLVGYETMHGRMCELANGTALSPGSLLGWLDAAYIERAVFAPGRRVEISATARLFTGATRRAIELRDQNCTHPYCDRPAAACDVDHVIPFAAGGPTTQENGRMLCGFHNRLRHQRPPPAESPVGA
ncbi:MAG: HNH endonuclease signature motif containing protein [Acidimicrobiales bacterium]